MTHQQTLALSRVFNHVEESQERKDQALAPFRCAAFAKSGSARKTHQGTSRLPNAAALKVAYAQMACVAAARACPSSRAGTYSSQTQEKTVKDYRSGIHPATKAASSITGFPNRPTPAMGIPDRQDYGDPASLSEGDLVDYFIQRHEARRAGPHYDLRMGTPETNLYSWATKKEVPEPGGRIAVYLQPVHSYAYGPFEGILGPGYGHGTVKQHRKGKLRITKSGPDGIHFTTADETPRRFVLVPPRKSGDRRWLLVAAKDVPNVPKVPNQEQNI